MDNTRAMEFLGLGIDCYYLKSVTVSQRLLIKFIRIAVRRSFQ